MHYTYKTGGTCSTMIDFDIIDGKLHNIVFTNGCNGNLKAIGSLLEGADPKFAIERLSERQSRYCNLRLYSERTLGLVQCGCNRGYNDLLLQQA